MQLKSYAFDGSTTIIYNHILRLRIMVKVLIRGPDTSKIAFAMLSD